MKKKIIELNINGKKKKIEVNIVPKWYEGIGLIGKGKKYHNNLLFDLKKEGRQPIHSCFVFADFYAVWCDKNFNVIESRKVCPWRFYETCFKNFRYLLEVPFGSSDFKFFKGF